MPSRLIASAALLLAGGWAAAQPPSPVPHDPALEVVPADEPGQIEALVRLTVEEMRKKYAASTPALRGVHPKDHGCVKAAFRVLDDLPAGYRVGVFARPGREYPAYLRFSNAGLDVTPDSPVSPRSPPNKEHASRGLAIKLLGVEGDRLVPRDEPLTQDFLLINQPVFASANVEDYVALRTDPAGFFAKRTQLPTPAGERARVTAGIVQRIKSLKVDGEKGAFQPPPASPDENEYFSGAPYRFGAGRAAKFSVRPVAAPPGSKPDLADPDYLRTALARKLAGPAARDIVLEFRVQVRTAEELAGKLDTEVENACTLWKEADTPFVPVARITIRPQDFNAREATLRCEALAFTPWHGIKEHQPLGGINRLKLAVYEASSAFRHLSKEPSGF